MSIADFRHPAAEHRIARRWQLLAPHDQYSTVSLRGKPSKGISSKGDIASGISIWHILQEVAQKGGNPNTWLKGHLLATKVSS